MSPRALRMVAIVAFLASATFMATALRRGHRAGGGVEPRSALGGAACALIGAISTVASLT